LIQKTRHLDSIVARALLVADFIDSIDPQRTLKPARQTIKSDRWHASENVTYRNN
jgi:hypothetical protein